MTMNAEIGRYSRAITWRSMVALLFGIFVIQPAIIYYTLLSGVPLPLAPWILIILWAELSRLLGSPLTKQEVYILLSFQGMASIFALWYLNPIYGMYMGSTPASFAFGMAQDVPDWYAPPPDVASQLMNTRWIFLNPIWIKPLFIMTSVAAFWVITDVSMGYICYSLFVREQKLGFPLATAQAEVVVTLAERRKKPMRVLMLSALAGVVVNFAISFLPFLLGPFLSSSWYYIGAAQIFWSPLLYLDYTPYLAPMLPGAGLAFTFDLSQYVIGFLLPPAVTLAQLVGAFSLYFVGTHLITRFDLWPSESPYSTSWPLDQIAYRAQLYFFISVIMGLALAATLVPLARRPRAVIRAFSALARKGEKEPVNSGLSERLPPYTLLLTLFFGACLANVALIYFLIPDPSLILSLLLFVVGGSFFLSFLSSGAAGVTASGFGSAGAAAAGFAPPYQTEFFIYSLGHRGWQVWFTPFVLYNGGAGIAQSFLQADGCGAKKTDFVKAYVIVTVLGLISSFLFISLFWSISPIPSGAYPATIAVWPVSTLDWIRTREWIWRGFLFRYDLILYSFIAGTIMYIITDFAKMPYFLIAFVTGAGGLGVGGGGGLFAGAAAAWLAGRALPNATAQFVGSLIGAKLIAPKIGVEEFNSLRGNLVLGFTIGIGFIELLRSCLILLGKSMWLLPY